MIPFNQPSIVGNELKYISEAIAAKKLSGNGKFTRKCNQFFEDKYGFHKCYLTNSCTAALEMCALLIDIKPGDEIILPAYTFVSTANAFLLRGTKLVFADSHTNEPNIDADNLEELITERTKAIVVVHYAGVACNMNKILNLCSMNNIFLIEDAAQGIDGFYNETPLGSIGDLACFSFHDTKNIHSGEGGLLVVNNKYLSERAEVIWQHGTNKSAFQRGELDKYTWIDIGSSFMPSEITAAFLYGQLECLDKVQVKRKELWEKYYNGLKYQLPQDKVSLPYIPEYARNTGHMFYLLFKGKELRKAFIQFMKNNGVQVVFHYLSLNESEFFLSFNETSILNEALKYENGIVRLPLFYELSERDVDFVVDQTLLFFNGLN